MDWVPSLKRMEARIDATFRRDLAAVGTLMNGKFALTDAIFAMSMVLPPPTAINEILVRSATCDSLNFFHCGRTDDDEPRLDIRSPGYPLVAVRMSTCAVRRTINPAPSSLSSVRTLAVSRIASCSITTILGSCIHCFIGDHLAVDLGNFIYQYYINPIIYDTGYNPVNTITWAIILGLRLIWSR